MKVTIVKDGKIINDELEIIKTIDEFISELNELAEDEDKEFVEDMNFFDERSEQSYAMYAGLIAVNDFLLTGEKLVKENEDFTEEDFEYGIKVLNACMKRKAKEVGGNYTLVIKPLKEE